MTLQLDSELSEALDAEAKRAGKPAEEVAVETLRARFGASSSSRRPEWLVQLLMSSRNYGVQLSDQALSSEGIY